MQRKIENTLLKWKESEKRKPLILIGARQTGKTYIIKKFGETHFENIIFVDFEKTERAKTIFNEDISANTIIPQLEILTNVRFISGKTLIILDEIQACPRAITALKYFYDSGMDVHVIGAGSLLGVAIKREDFSFPVGKVITEKLYPLDFEEFLLALDRNELRDMCFSSFLKREKLPQAIHEELISLYRDYLIVGGMPEVVSEYVKNKSFLTCSEIQSQILSDYRADIAKYADSSSKLLAQRAFDTIPIQLAKENNKFQYNVIRKGATAGLFGPSIEWLNDSGLVLKCKRITDPFLPIKAYEDISSFKLYLLDPGLLVQMSALPKEVIINQLGLRFIGSLTENYVASELVQNNIPLFYWTSQDQAEIDFILQVKTNVIPVEVKSSEHTKSKSLSAYRKKFSPSLSIRISSKNFGFEDGLLSLPLYSAWLLNEENLSCYL